MLLDQVHRVITTHHLLDAGARVLVGLSGGVDSVVLVHLLFRLGFVPVAAHVNFQLRSEASEEDEEFVRQYCASLQIPLHVVRFDTREEAQKQGKGIQETARMLRYDFFSELAETEAIPAVAVAHHVDDQAETVLLHLLRGAGPEGLAGMPLQRTLTPENKTTLIRPLLQSTRVEIETYALAEGLTWREDASNDSLKYQRGVIRHLILPLLEQHFGNATTQIARSASLMREYVEDIFSRDLKTFFDQVADPPKKSLNLKALQGLAPVWQRRVILEALQRWLPEAPYRASVLDQIIQLFDAQPGRRIQLEKGSVGRERDAFLFFSQEEEPEASQEWLLQPSSSLDTGQGHIEWMIETTGPEDLKKVLPTEAWLDADSLHPPLTVRRWQPGDRLQPLGMAGSQKVSDLLTNTQTPVFDREKTLVVLSEDQIVWLVGYRLAHPFRVQPHTKRWARLIFTPAS